MRRFPLTRQEFLWLIIIVMLGINMAWTASLINPVLQIAENQRFLAKLAVTQNEDIIDNTVELEREHDIILKRLANST